MLLRERSSGSSRRSSWAWPHSRVLCFIHVITGAFFNFSHEPVRRMLPFGDKEVMRLI